MCLKASSQSALKEGRPYNLHPNQDILESERKLCINNDASTTKVNWDNLRQSQLAESAKISKARKINLSKLDKRRKPIAERL